MLTRNIVLFGIVMFSLFTTGCVSAKNALAGEIGCKPDDIEISDSRTMTLADYYQATCKGKTYQCSGSGNIFSAYQAKCKEAE